MIQIPLGVGHHPSCLLGGDPGFRRISRRRVGERAGLILFCPVQHLHGESDVIARLRKIGRGVADEILVNPEPVGVMVDLPFARREPPGISGRADCRGGVNQRLGSAILGVVRGGLGGQRGGVSLIPE